MAGCEGMTIDPRRHPPQPIAREPAGFAAFCRAFTDGVFPSDRRRPSDGARVAPQGRESALLGAILRGVLG